MALDKFLELSNFIDNDTIPEDKMETKIIQLVDLIWFIDIYNPSTVIKNFLDTDYNIIYMDDKLIGVFFCEQINDIDKSFSPQVVNNIKIDKMLSEFWIVLVNDTLFNKSTFDFQNLSTIHYFDQIFKFNFFQNSIEKVIL